MRPFAFDHASTLAGAVQAAGHAQSAFLAGGTTLIDLMKLDVMQPDGTLVNWAFETASPSNLFRRGFRKDTIKPGTVVVIEGYGAKDGTHTGNGQRLTMPDGTKYILGTEENPG